MNRWVSHVLAFDFGMPWKSNNNFHVNGTLLPVNWVALHSGAYYNGMVSEEAALENKSL